jgi:hypothetical protein
MDILEISVSTYRRVSLIDLSSNQRLVSSVVQTCVMSLYLVWIM